MAAIQCATRDADRSLRRVLPELSMDALDTWIVTHASPAYSAEGEDCDRSSGELLQTLWRDRVNGVKQTCEVIPAP